MNRLTSQLLRVLREAASRLGFGSSDFRVSVSSERHRTLRWFLSGLVSVATVSACIENGLHPVVLILLPTAIAGLLRSDYSKPLLWSEKPMTLIFMGYTILFSVGALMLQGSLTLPRFLVYFTFGTVVIRSVLPLPDRYISQVLFLSIGMILANCVLTNNIVFAALLPPYLFFLMGSMLLLNSARNEADSTVRFTKTSEPDLKSFGRGLVKYVLLIVLFTAVSFAFLPRPFLSFPGIKAAMARGTGGARLSGELTYRDMLGMAGRQRIAFVATFSAQLPKEEPYWRGRVLDKTDGSRWFDSEEKRRAGLPVSPYGKDIIKYSILPHRLQSNTLYVYGYPVAALGHRRQLLYINGIGEVTVDNPFLHTDLYRISAVKRHPPLNKPLHPIYLDDSKAPQKVKRLAEELTKGAKTKQQKARAIMEYFRSEFTYKLDAIPPPEGVNPLEHFLFSSKTGHCEYYAGALALLLRCADVPARVVEGFAGMERTDNPKDVIVRFSNAHAWVEALIDEDEWTTLDATPPSARTASSNRYLRFLSDLYDRVEYQWIKSVVNYDLIDQLWLLNTLRDLATGQIKLRNILSVQTSYLVGAAVAAIIVVTVVVRIRRRWHRQGVTEIYLSTMHLFKKKGILTEVHQWQEENARSIIERVPDARGLLDEFMEVYSQMRFGGNRVPKERLLKAQRALLSKMVSGKNVT